LLALSSGRIQVAQTHQRVAIPDTPAGKQLKRWLEVFAAGKQEEFARFVTAHYSKSLIEQQGSAVNWADRHARTFLDARSFAVRRVEKSTPEEIVVLVQASLTDLWYRLTMKVETGPPYSIAEYGSQRVRPPVGFQQSIHEPELIRQAGAFMNKLARADAFSGTFLIAQNGRPLLMRAYGDASKAHQIPNRLDTRFNIASIGKNFTAVSIMQLVEQGKLSLTDKVGRILPDYPSKDVRDRVTIAHLLSHSSGLGDIHGPKYVAAKDMLREVKDYLPLFSDLQLSFQPGERMQYSNAGYILLGAIIEKVSGENYFDYVREHIFIRSGMIHSGFYEADVDTLKLATGYTNYRELGDDFQQFELGQRRNTLRYGTIRGNPQGGAYSTVGDLWRYSLALRQHKLLSATSLALMTTNKYFFRKYGAGDIYYGYGFELEKINGKRVIGHGGGDLGISSVIRWYPDSGNYTVVVLSNYDRGGIIAIDKLQELITQGKD
jgi:CubicO group peptidase (beta-lactamase class C family)